MSIQCLDCLGNKIEDGDILEFHDTSQYKVKLQDNEYIITCLNQDLPTLILRHICVNNQLTNGKIVEKQSK